MKTKKDYKQTDNVDFYIKQGDSFYNQDNYKEALDCYLKYINSNQGNAKIYKKMGDCYFYLSNFAKAEEYFLKAIEINPSYSNAYYNLGILYKGQKKYEQAESYYLKTIELDPDYRDAYNNLGVLYRKQKKYDQSEQCYLKAIELDPNDVAAFINLANIYMDQNCNAKSEQYYLKAIELGLYQANAYNNLGILYRNQEKYDQSEQCLLKSIEIDPNYAAPYNSLGVLYHNQEKYDQAEQCYLKAIELDPNYVEAIFNLGNIYREQWCCDKSERYYLKAIELDPNYIGPYINLGILYRNQEKYDQSEQCYLKAIELDPGKDKGICYYNLAKLYDLQGKKKEDSFKYIKKSADLGYKYAYIYISSYYNDGLILFEEAIDYLKKAVDAGVSEAYLELGNLYSQPEHYDKETALKYLSFAKDNGFDCDYLIGQIQNNFKNEFIEKLREYTKSNDVSEAVFDFCEQLIGSDYQKIDDTSKEMVARCIINYMTESRFGFSTSDYSLSIHPLAKALENILDKYLGRNLVSYIKRSGLEEKYQSIALRRQSRTLGEYQYEYKKEERVLDKVHIDALRECFKSNLFNGTNGDIRLTNYITNLVKEIKKFSEVRNEAAHKGTISKEKCERWIDKMIGGGQMLQNFLHNLKE